MKRVENVVDQMKIKQDKMERNIEEIQEAVKSIAKKINA